MVDIIPVPAHEIGDTVLYEVTYKNEQIKLGCDEYMTKHVVFTITGIHLETDGIKRAITYDLSHRLPTSQLQSPIFFKVEEDDLQRNPDE